MIVHMMSCQAKLPFSGQQWGCLDSDCSRHSGRRVFHAKVPGRGLTIALNHDLLCNTWLGMQFNEALRKFRQDTQVIDLLQICDFHDINCYQKLSNFTQLSVILSNEVSYLVDALRVK